MRDFIFPNLLQPKIHTFFYMSFCSGRVLPCQNFSSFWITNRSGRTAQLLKSSGVEENRIRKELKLLTDVVYFSQAR